MGFEPVGADTAVGNQGNSQMHYVLHLAHWLLYHVYVLWKKVYAQEKHRKKHPPSYCGGCVYIRTYQILIK